jgi:ribosomal protein S18 acetylase RimI-like enzyme
MHTSSIREVDLERDAPAVVELIREISPGAVVNVASWLQRERAVPPRAEPRSWVWESEGHVVGIVEVWRAFFGTNARTGFVNIAVAETHRRRGIGSALFEIGSLHLAALDVDDVLTTFHENDAGIAFATRLGFRPVRAESEAVLDPRMVRETPDPAVDLRAVRDVDPRVVHAVDLEATLDLPATEPIEDIPYDEWVKHVLEHPLFTTEGSFVAFVDGEATAVSLLTFDAETGRAHNMFTGTLRAYRGRGLGLAVKLASIHWAAERGATSMSTHNDETNAPMLAINRRLGYLEAGRRVEWLRAGTASSPVRPAPAT